MVNNKQQLWYNGDIILDYDLEDHPTYRNWLMNLVIVSPQFVGYPVYELVRVTKQLLLVMILQGPSANQTVCSFLFAPCFMIDKSSTKGSSLCLSIYKYIYIIIYIYTYTIAVSDYQRAVFFFEILECPCMQLLLANPEVIFFYMLTTKLPKSLHFIG
jgi:hypothetical protein